MAARSCPARWPGTCDKCDKPFPAGTLITWNPRKKGSAAHVSCSDPAAGARAPLTPPGKAPTGAYQDSTATPEEAPAMPSEPKTHTEAPQASPDGNAAAQAISGLVAAILPGLQAQLASKADAGQIKSLVEAAMLDPRLVNRQVDALTAALSPEALAAIIKPVVEAEAKNLVLPRRIIVDATLQTGEVKHLEDAHPALATVVRHTAAGRMVYLWGPPGAGKTYLGFQALEAVGLEHRYISLNPQSPESKAAGFIDAMGRFVCPVLVEAYRDGLGLVIDEVDNGSANFLAALNGALANGRASFACGMVARHDRFRLILTANTAGRGQDLDFPDRRALDPATLDRFTFVRMDYDHAHETGLALAHNAQAKPWVDWCHAMRAWLKSNKIRVWVTPRAMMAGAAMLAEGFDVAEVAESAVWKGLDAEIVKRALAAHPLPRARMVAK